MPEDEPRLTLIGTYGSPYSLKMRAVLRYRRIPFTWIIQGTDAERALPQPKVAIIPVIGFPDPDGEVREVMVDSTPQIARLEREFSEGRSLVPSDPVVAFLDRLVEDYADEWVTKMMYHYRWYPSESIERAGKLLPRWPALHATDDALERFGQFMIDRQTGRRALVGCTDENAPIVESAYVRLLGLLDSTFQRQDFLFGDRPGSSDFGLFGQLSQLVIVERPSTDLCIEHGARVYSWVNRVDDLSWWAVDGESGWFERDVLRDSLGPILAEIGGTYAVFMESNDAALRTGADEVVCEIDGKEFRQTPFAYQGKCLQWMREDFSSLSDADQRAVLDILAGSGCERLFQ
jgi:glutathione S-transferase